MYKIKIYDDNEDVVFSKTINDELKEVNIKTFNEEINFCINKKKVNLELDKFNELMGDDSFWDD